MVDGKFLLEYINERNTRECMGCFGTLKKPIIDNDGSIMDLILSLRHSCDSNLRFNTYKDYCDSLYNGNKPMPLSDFQLLEKITDEVSKGIFRRSRTTI